MVMLGVALLAPKPGMVHTIVDSVTRYSYGAYRCANPGKLNTGCSRVKVCSGYRN